MYVSQSVLPSTERKTCNKLFEEKFQAKNHKKMTNNS